MQLMYAVMFLIALVAGVSSLSEREAVRSRSHSTAVAEQMIIWHRAAVDRCVKLTCPAGTIDPITTMSPQVSGQPAFRKGYFTTRYDPISRLIVTHMPSNMPITPDVTMSTVAASMKDLVLQRDLSSVGIWNGSEAVRFTMPQGAARPIPMIDVPPGFLGVTIPRGSPIIAQRL